VNKSQRRAIVNYRRRLRQRGISRYEVRGLITDKELVRSLAKRLSRNDAAAGELREEVARKVNGDQPLRRGGLVAVLRRSPLVGSELNVKRKVDRGRKIDL